jgi:peptide/nickel transport system substrate-binding protein
LRLIADDSDATLANTAVVLQDQLAYAGIALGVEPLDAQELADETAAGAFDLLVTYTPPWRDPHELVRPLLASDGVQNHAGYASPRVDALIRNATLTNDQEQRADRYARLQERVLEDMPVIVLFRPFAFDAMTSRLTNYGLYPPVTSRGLASAVLNPAES